LEANSLLRAQNKTDALHNKWRTRSVVRGNKTKTKKRTTRQFLTNVVEDEWKHALSSLLPDQFPTLENAVSRQEGLDSRGN
jgi:hypothetical protein